MYAQNINIKSSLSGVQVRVKGELFYELNGRLFNPGTAPSVSEGVTTIRHSFLPGDRFGAYARLPINQPDKYEASKRDDIVSSTLARMKQIQLSPYGVSLRGSGEYSFLNTSRDIIDVFARANPNKFYMVEVLESFRLTNNYWVISPEYFIAKAIEENMLKEATGFQIDETSRYFILYTGAAKKEIVQLVDDILTPGVSQLARHSIKRDSYQVFRFKSLVDLGWLKLF